MGMLDFSREKVKFWFWDTLGLAHAEGWNSPGSLQDEGTGGADFGGVLERAEDEAADGASSDSLGIWLSAVTGEADS